MKGSTARRLETRTTNARIVLEDLENRLPSESLRTIKFLPSVTTNSSIREGKCRRHRTNQRRHTKRILELGKITKLITSSDGNVRAAKVLLATRNVVNRSLNLLYPLECENDFTDSLNHENGNRNNNTEDTIDQTDENEKQPVRS